MIITDKLVFIHLPKTGGTFVESVLRKIHQKRGDIIEERREDAQTPWLNRVKRMVQHRPTFLKLNQEVREGFWDQHGRVDMIPKEHAHKPIITILRNPLDRYVSEYEFNWWKTNPGSFRVDLQQMSAQFPKFPELTLSEFIEVLNDYVERPGKMKRFSKLLNVVGRYTLQFLMFYMVNPPVERYDEAYLRQGLYLDDLPPNLHFLFMHNLNQNLHDVLLTLGYGADEVSFILNQQKIYPKEGGRSQEQTWQQYYTPELLKEVRERERILFQFFTEFEQSAPNLIKVPELKARIKS
jgi:hypothetical protein